MSIIANAPTPIVQDLQDFFVGDLIGSGSFRDVFRARQQPGVVVKVEKCDSVEFANVTEWQVWKAVKGTRFERYFAPCLDISFGGKVLTMRYCPPVKGWPKDAFPEVLADFRHANIGRYKGRTVMIDYGRHCFLDFAVKNAKLVVPNRTDWRFVEVEP